MHGELLWVYEGLTQYLGGILTARSGLWTPEEYREYLALSAAAMDRQAGRNWRPLADTAVAAQILYDAREDWAAARRSVDFYPESELLWLQADTIIRQESRGAKSLDDFCRLFFGGESGPPAVVTYGFDDVVEALGKTAPYDWRTFWRSHLDKTSEHAPLDGVSASGWTLAYTDRIPQMQKSTERRDDVVDVRFSLGFQVKESGAAQNESGVIQDVLPGSPADRAGIGPGMTLIAANGRRFSRETLRDAIHETKTLSRPIELLVENSGFFRTHRLEWNGGESYPSLERDAAKPDLLGEILKPRSAPPAASAPGS
jgi:predicted metalloprotease with PDZ domain